MYKLLSSGTKVAVHRCVCLSYEGENVFVRGLDFCRLRLQKRKETRSHVISQSRCKLGNSQKLFWVLPKKNDFPVLKKKLNIPRKGTGNALCLP